VNRQHLSIAVAGGETNEATLVARDLVGGGVAGVCLASRPQVGLEN
jgi:hypothetical protein